MKEVPADKFGNRDLEGLLRFLEYVRESALTSGHPAIASISLRVSDQDPLAVLQAIQESNEPHLYLERGSTSVSGAESVVRLDSSGPDRFDEASAFVKRWSEHIVKTGDLDGWFSGPLFFHAFAFNEMNSPAATVFIPRWQVCRTDRECIAVANVLVEESADLLPEAQRILRAHKSVTESSYRGVGAGSLVSVRHVRAEATERFRERVEQALSTIQNTTLEKVVLSRWLDLEAEDDFRPLETLRLLRESYPNCFAFSYSRGSGASWIGATPERLVRLRNGRFDTEAIAGSVARGSSLSEDSELGENLLLSEKDLREHRFVVEEISRSLEGLGLCPEAARNPQLLRLPNVQHLRTPISGQNPEGLSLIDLIGALHPTPAVNGVPHQEAGRLIEELESFSRGLYSGCLGWEKPSDSGESVVALRTARMEGDSARLFAGAGIVEGSSPQKELRETEIKFAAMLSALGVDR
ncbi:MAG: isochorismate synthase [Verrucomicrobiota bacterium]